MIRIDSRTVELTDTEREVSGLFEELQANGYSVHVSIILLKGRYQLTEEFWDYLAS